jgi:TNF receptor-associated factor 2/TNF receptor-associated factor 3
MRDPQTSKWLNNNHAQSKYKRNVFLRSGCKNRLARLRNETQVGESTIKNDHDLRKLLLLAGDIETNPGTEKRANKRRVTKHKDTKLKEKTEGDKEEQPTGWRNRIPREIMQIHEIIIQDITFLEEMAKSLKCIACRGVLQLPKQLGCGHRACSRCETQLLNGKKSCPCSDQKCNEEVGGSFLDNCARQEILKLRVKCVNNNSCNWTGRLKNIEEHWQTSPNCLQASQQLAERRTGEFIDTYREAIRDEKHVHERRTKHFSEIARQFTHHQTEGNKQDQSWVNMTRRLQSETTSIQHKLSENRSKIWDLAEEIQVTNKQVKELMHEIRDFYLNQSTKIKNSEPREGEDKLIDSLLKKVAQEVADIKDQHGIVQEEQKQSYQEKKKAIESSIKRIEDTHNSCIDFMRDLELKTRLFQSSTTDGNYTWKLDRIAERVREAEQGLCKELYTPPLYSNVSGYKYCLKIMLDGDKQSEVYSKIGMYPPNHRNEYIGIYFILMLGDFDEILEFPLAMECKISILDQSNEKNHITKTIRPDDSVLFKKPEREMNPATGYPMFASKYLLMHNASTYVVEDALFIRSEMRNRQTVDITGEMNQYTPSEVV